MNPASSSHLDSRGEASMVDVASKQISERTAVAGCEVLMKPEALDLLRSGTLKKGDAFTVAKVAGIQAAKKTSDMIPLCHPLALDHIGICFSDLSENKGVSIECTVKTTAKTGVEMEALTGAMAAALTIYDMAKAVDPGMIITNLRLLKKQGGKSDYSR